MTTTNVSVFKATDTRSRNNDPAIGGQWRQRSSVGTKNWRRNLGSNLWRRFLEPCFWSVCQGPKS